MQRCLKQFERKLLPALSHTAQSKTSSTSSTPFYAAILFSSLAHISSMSVVTTCSSDESLVSLSATSAVSSASIACSNDGRSHAFAIDAHAFTAELHDLPRYTEPACLRRL